MKACLLRLLVLTTLSACGGGGNSSTGAERSDTPLADVSIGSVIPESGLYASEQYSTAQLNVLTELAFSTRPNQGGLQYTSDTGKPFELGSDTLILKLDIAIPPNATADTPQPLIVWIHGGGFSSGSKEELRGAALTYARAGFVVASVNYRLSPYNTADSAARLAAIRQASEDVMNAIRFLKANASRYHIDTSRIATMGISAGGGISLINAVEFDSLQNTQSDLPSVSSRISAAVSSGATLVDAAINMDAYLHYTADDSPVLLFHAAPTDSVTGATWNGHVIPTESRINGSGNSCTLVAQPDMTHTADLALGGPWWAILKPFLWDKLKLAEI